MIEAKISRESGCSVEGSGGPIAQANDILLLINGVYNGFLLAQDALGCMAFKAMLLMALNNDDGPTWKRNETAQGYATRVPKRQTPPDQFGSRPEEVMG